jgi:hypothetical protein
MALIEIHTFRLRDGVDDATFLHADERVQQDFVPNLTGFVRRTAARGDAGSWLVLTLWYEAANADAAAAIDNEARARFVGLIDPATERVERYNTLD